jgi:Arc/MetJ-type ribon-helix-helix transcriptional regulator
LNYYDLKSSDPYIKESIRKKLEKIEVTENIIENLKIELKDGKEKVNKKRKEFEEKQLRVRSAGKKFKKIKENENQEIKKIFFFLQID